MTITEVIQLISVILLIDKRSAKMILDARRGGPAIVIGALTGLGHVIVVVSPAYIVIPSKICRLLLRSTANAGNNNAARMAIMAMTTSSSMRVKACAVAFWMYFFFQCFAGNDYCDCRR